jgi:hypothetical protein
MSQVEMISFFLLAFELGVQALSDDFETLLDFNKEILF